MLSRNTTLFLIVASCYRFGAVVLLELHYYASSPEHYRSTLQSFLSLGIILLLPIALSVIGTGLRRERSRQLKAGGIALAALGAIWVCTEIYRQTQFSDLPDKQHSQTVILIARIVERWFGYLQPVCMTVAGILFAGTGERNMKRGAAWMIAGALPFLFELFFSAMYGLVLNYHFYNNLTGSLTLTEMFVTFVRFVMIAFPVAIIAAGFSLLKKYAPTEGREKEARTSGPIDEPLSLAADESSPVPTVATWLKQYLLAAIPLAGIVLLGMWTVDRRDHIRRNWSAAALLARIPGAALALFLYIPLLAEQGKQEVPDNYFTLAFIFLLALITGAGILLILHLKNKPNAADNDGNPSLLTWIGNFLILAVPLIGIICLIIWATDSRNAVIKRWAVARLIWIAIAVVGAVYGSYYISEILDTISNTLTFQF
jgi:hypothetical protein